MRSTGKILIIDDEAGFLDLYETLLGDEGYLVETAKDRSTALQKLDQPDWDVVLLDQKLQGPEGPDSGLDLIGEIGVRAPGAKIILVTAYASDAAVKRAYKLGAYDYLEKGSLFQVLLIAKLRNAVEAARALRFGELSTMETEARIGDLWTAVGTEVDANRKGKLLEDLMVLLFRTIPGFHQTTPRRQNDIEEIDLLIQNGSADPFWVNERTSYILVECKNWSKPAGVAELRSFLYKIERRFGRCRLGFLIAPGGFAGTFKDALLVEKKDDHLVILVDRDALRALVTASDRNAVLKKLHEDAVIGLNGH